MKLFKKSKTLFIIGGVLFALLLVYVLMNTKMDGMTLLQQDTQNVQKSLDQTKIGN